MQERRVTGPTGPPSAAVLLAQNTAYLAIFMQDLHDFSESKIGLISKSTKPILELLHVEHLEVPYLSHRWLLLERDDLFACKGDFYKNKPRHRCVTKRR